MQEGSSIVSQLLAGGLASGLATKIMRLLQMRKIFLRLFCVAKSNIRLPPNNYEIFKKYETKAAADVIVAVLLLGRKRWSELHEDTFKSLEYHTFQILRTISLKRRDVM